MWIDLLLFVVIWAVISAIPNIFLDNIEVD